MKTQLTRRSSQQENVEDHAMRIGSNNRAVLLVAAVSLVASFGDGAIADAAQPGGVSIDAAFPGGNILVDKIQGNEVFVRQDLRDTSGSWFYWCFRARGAAGRTMTFHFTRGKVLAAQGPCYSLNRGATWQWLGAKRTNTADAPPGDGFVFRFPDDADEVRFCLSIPYLESDLKQFLARHQGNAAIRTEVLCKTAGGREAEVLYLGRRDDKADYRLAFTCRHHACESVASYVLEGLMEAMLADEPTGRWFRQHAAVVVVPFVDKDGVEAGDQGKNRKPHDHNRDYAGTPIYPTVAAVKRVLPAWSGNQLDVAIDLHGPSLHDGWLQFIGGPEEEIWQRTARLSHTLQSVQQGPLRHDPRHDMPFGAGWNKGSGLRGASFSGWVRSLPNLRIGTALEVPYSRVAGTAVTADAARATGRDLAEAMKRYLCEALPRGSCE